MVKLGTAIFTVIVPSIAGAHADAGTNAGQRYCKHDSSAALRLGDKPHCVAPATPPDSGYGSAFWRHAASI